MRFALCTILATLALTTVAKAENYAITVPVRIQNMRFAENVRVNCYVGFPGGGTLSMWTPVTLVDGSFTGDVTVLIERPPPGPAEAESRAEANRWGCSVVYVWRTADGSLYGHPFHSSDERNRTYTRDTGQVVASSRMEAQGVR